MTKLCEIHSCQHLEGVDKHCFLIECCGYVVDMLCTFYENFDIVFVVYDNQKILVIRF